jgi:transcriptional regulator with XRE-family HTH domain
MTLRLNIREIRQAKGLTLEAVAGRIGISIPHLSGVERGKKNLNNHLLTRLAAALDVPPETLIASEIRAESNRLDYVARQLPEEDLERLTAFAEALLASRQVKPQA